MKDTFIRTHYGNVLIREGNGKWIADIELSDGDNAEVREDSAGLYAVLFDGNWVRY